MQTYSHVLIGKTVHKFILDNLGLRLSASNLIFGCMKPDFSPKLVNIPHYKNQSFGVISKMIISLKQCQFIDSKRDVELFSMQLGIILHYITDYFCYAHNNKLMDKMPNHVLYEMKLELEMRKYLSKSFNADDLNLTSYDYIRLERSLIHYIEEKHMEYLKKMPGNFNDIYYSIQVCCLVALNICNSASFTVPYIPSPVLFYNKPASAI